jgi:acetolactate synthase-1/2/3 large subunit
MNGAESLVRTLIGAGVDTCFANPGTSEMHFVAALGRIGGMRSVLTLFEGVASGAADGYARMRDKPAATLLHLGPGLGNALANLHNARKARSPIVNIVGDHATVHRAFDAPLTSDVEGIARPVSDWVRSAESAKTLAQDGVAAVAAAMSPPGKIATLILPADTAWGDGSEPAPPLTSVQPASVPDEAVAGAASVLRSGEPVLILLAGRGLREAPQRIAAAIAEKTGAALLAPTSNARIARGGGRYAIGRIPYPVGDALERLRGFAHVVLVGAAIPVAFFAYPDRPSLTMPPGTKAHVLARPEEDIENALLRLAEAVGAPDKPRHPTGSEAEKPTRPSGALSGPALAAAIRTGLTEDAIVVDEAITYGADFYRATEDGPPHDWLGLTGGSIGIGPPLATGAAVACPDRRVLALQADGSAMYTLQALWTQAREHLNVTTVILANRAYKSLEVELRNVGASSQDRAALDLLDIGRPRLDWVSLAGGMGVEAVTVDSAERLADVLSSRQRATGPFLVEAVL